ncbi:MAG TPA: cysteine synthase family protein [Dehalococcoidia bacterium]|nr:cysteine synthase family protein [Dehalococcoidia bacterium]
MVTAHRVMLYRSMLDLIGNTPLVELQNLSPSPTVRFFAKLEGQNPTGSVKDRIARAMIENAEREGKLTPGCTILEPTSGNTGVSLAFVAKLKGYKVKVVMPDNVSHERTALLRAYGAEIVYSEGLKGTNGSIEVAQELAAADPSVIMLYQYGNEWNPRAHYESTGPEILRDLPEVDVFVAGLGTGGTLTGTGRYLKERKPSVKVIAAAPHPGDLVQGLRSLEDGFIPPVLDQTILDGRIVVDSRNSFAATKELMDKDGVFAGISGGAVLKTAQRYASRVEQANIVLLLADGGWKYLSTDLWNADYSDLPDDIDAKVWW